MSPMQLFWSKRLLLRDGDLLKRLEQGSLAPEINTDKNANAWKRLNSLLAQLRKAANHPYLFPGDTDPLLVC
jgi:hypothetical protein